MLPAWMLLLIHFLAAGFQTLLNQVAARDRCDRILYTYVVAATTCLCLVPFLMVWIRDEPFLREIYTLDHALLFLLYALAFGVLGGAYATVTYARLRAQQLLPTYIFTPLSRLSLLLVVFLSVMFLGERRSMLELIAIGLAFVPLMMFHRTSKHNLVHRMHRTYGVTWTLLAATGAAGLQIASKLFVDPRFGVHMHVVAFVFGVNAGNMVVSALVRGSRKDPFQRPKRTLALGLLAGIVNVFSFMTLVTFLVRGDVSTIYPVSSLSLLIPVVVLMLLKREPAPTGAQWIAFVISILALYVLVS